MFEYKHQITIMTDTSLCNVCGTTDKLTLHSCCSTTTCETCKCHHDTFTLYHADPIRQSAYRYFEAKYRLAHRLAIECNVTQNEVAFNCNVLIRYNPDTKQHIRMVFAKLRGTSNCTEADEDECTCMETAVCPCCCSIHYYCKYATFQQALESVHILATSFTECAYCRDICCTKVDKHKLEHRAHHCLCLECNGQDMDSSDVYKLNDKFACVKCVNNIAIRGAEIFTCDVCATDLLSTQQYKFQGTCQSHNAKMCTQCRAKCSACPYCRKPNIV